MNISIANYSLAPIHEKDAWRLCNFVVSNESRLKTYFPKTLEQNLTPTLAEIFVAKKVKQFHTNEEYLFVIKENENRTIIGLVYLKELQKKKGQGELAYCIGYQYENKGIISAFLKRIISWSLTEIGLDTLQIMVHKSNVASIKVALKNNFHFVKQILKAHQLPNGELVTMQLYELNSISKNNL